MRETRMHRSLYRAACLLVFLIGFVVPALASVQVTDHTYPLSPGGEFTLKNINGSVQVDGWEREAVEVEAVKTARSNPSDLDRVQIDVRRAAGSIAVYTRYPEGDSVEVAVDYRIHVPYRVLLGGVETVNGSVTVRGVDGSGELRSVNGDVDVMDSSGRFTARTTNGNVHLDLRRLHGDGPMDLATVNGSLLLALPDDTRATLSVRSMNGDFQSELALETTTSLGARVFRARLGAAAGNSPQAADQDASEVTLSTVNGAIRVVRERPSV
jgi:Putative adhesin